jgi:uncharacterized protein (DUF427 family)
VLLAESTRPVLLFETNLPTRYYLPRDDVRAPARPSAKRTFCPYKGQASYLSFEASDDLAWYYPDPLPDIVAIAGLVSFYNELVEITVDGEPEGGPEAPLRQALLDEFGIR